MKNHKTLVISALLFTLLLSSCNTYKSDSFNDTVEKHIIPVNQAISMHHEYNTTRYSFLKDKLKSNYSNPEFQDTKFVWFSLEDMKNYLSYIEAIQKANPEEDISGIRVYFAAYPNKTSSQGKTIKHPGQQTFFMVPTLKSKNVLDRQFNNLNHLPFYIERYTNDDPLKGNYKIIDSLMFNYKKRERLDTYHRLTSSGSTTTLSFSRIEASTNSRETSTVFNEGELSPPPKD